MAYKNAKKTGGFKKGGKRARMARVKTAPKLTDAFIENPKPVVDKITTAEEAESWQFRIEDASRMLYQIMDDLKEAVKAARAHFPAQVLMLNEHLMLYRGELAKLEQAGKLVDARCTVLEEAEDAARPRCECCGRKL